MRNTTLSSIKKKGREELQKSLMGLLKENEIVKHFDMVGLEAFRQKAYKVLDKQIEVAYEAGLKRAIYSILGNIKLTEEQIKTLKTELQIIPPQGRKRKYGKNN